MYPISTATAVILGLWLVILSIRVIGARRSENASSGDNGSQILTRRIRAQGNLSEYAPLGLILIFLAESQGSNFWIIALSAGALVLGRLLHGYAFSFTDGWAFGRVGGMLLTFGAFIILSLANAVLLFA